MRKLFQKVIQFVILALFILLFLKGKIQAFLILFLLGIAASFLFGRIYCGWNCPIHTVLVGVTRIKRKLHLHNVSIPQFILKSWVRYLMFGLIIAVFIFSLVTGRKLPVFPILFGLGIFLTLIYPEELWHRYVCPYGFMLSLSSSKSLHRIHINEELCNNCGACSRVCPVKAVAKTEVKHQIQKADCLVCMKCADHCKQDAIRYQ